MKKEQLQKEARTLSHPRDRRVRQLQKKEKRLMKITSRKQSQEDEKLKKVMKCLWFRTQCIALGYTATLVPDEIVGMLIQLYIDRHRDELNELKKGNRAAVGRERELEALRTQEMMEFQSSGIAIPDLSTSDEVEILTNIWDGASETFSVLHWKCVKKKGTSDDESKLNELRKKLVTLEEVRSEVERVLPLRLKNKNNKLKKLPVAKQNVKRFDKTEDIRKRSAARQTKMQMQRLKRESSAALAELRTSLPN